MSGIDAEIDHVRSIGRGIVGLIDVAILLAIVAVVISKRSDSVTVIRALFQFLSWLVGQIVTPLNPVATLQLSNTLAPAGGYTTSSGDTGDGYSYSTTSDRSAPIVGYAVRDASGHLASLSPVPVFGGQQPYTGAGSVGSPIPEGQ
jgi:hypothetical protein